METPKAQKIVDRMMKRTAGQHQTVQERNRQADIDAFGLCLQHPAAGRAVPDDVIVTTPE